MVYVVKPGDTLGGIARRHGTTVEALQRANPQIKNANRIAVGDQVQIPGGSGGGGAAPGGGSGGAGGGGGKPGGGAGGATDGGANGGQPPRGGGSVQSGDWTLPTEGTALKLVASDFDKAARELDCEVAAVRAVSEVEAGGRTGFDAKKRPKILFEVHLFQKNTGHKYDKSHPHLSAPYKSKTRKESYKKDQWAVIAEAFALDREAAVKSVSWGMFQVLGSNFKMCGWKDVRSFVSDMFVSEGQHMRAFLGYCRGANLVRHLKTKSWAAFAKGYNGPDYASNAYDTKMANAYKRYSDGDKKGSAAKTAAKK